MFLFSFAIVLEIFFQMTVEFTLKFFIDKPRAVPFGELILIYKT